MKGQEESAWHPGILRRAYPWHARKGTFNFNGTGPVRAAGLACMAAIPVARRMHRLKSPFWFRHMPRKPDSGPARPESYADAVQQLEQLIAALESGQLPLEELLGQYQRGAELLRYCRERLQAVEEQVKVLDEDGVARPWTPE